MRNALDFTDVEWQEVLYKINLANTMKSLAQLLQGKDNHGIDVELLLEKSKMIQATVPDVAEVTEEERQEMFENIYDNMSDNSVRDQTEDYFSGFTRHDWANELRELRDSQPDEDGEDE